MATIFVNLFQKALKAYTLPKTPKRNRSGYLSVSEMLLIELLFHFSAYKDFKHYYLYGILMEHRDKFGKLPCYQRFVQLKQNLFMPVVLLLHCLKGKPTGIYFADSTTLKVCDNKRISTNKVFEQLATRGKSTMGWFYGLKLHLLINNKGQVMAVKITPGNTDERRLVSGLLKGLKGKCYAHKGYISKELFKRLWQEGIHLVTGIRKNMKNALMPIYDKWLLRKRFIIETVLGILKTDMSLEHTRHRCATNAFVHILSSNRRILLSLQ